MEVKKIKEWLLAFSQEARREGLLSLGRFVNLQRIAEEEGEEGEEVILDDWKQDVSNWKTEIGRERYGEEGEYFRKGLELITDGLDPTTIEKILSFLEKAMFSDKRLRIKMIKEGILAIQRGDNPRITQEILDAISPV